MSLTAKTLLHREACRVLLNGPMRREELFVAVERFVLVAQAIQRGRRRREWNRERHGVVCPRAASSLEDMERLGRRHKVAEWLQNAKRLGTVTIDEGVVSLTPVGERRAQKVIAAAGGNGGAAIPKTATQVVSAHRPSA